MAMDKEILNGDWRNKAACLRVDPELFFPLGEKSQSDIDQIEKAKSFCVKCLVKERCLEYALEMSQDSGVWGGLSESERRALKRRQQRERVRARLGRMSTEDPQ